MYFFDLNDYRGACFFGPAASYVGDPEDDVGTYRATRDAYLKALNESIMGFFQLPNLDCATCLDCRDKFSAVHCELITFENSIEVITATLLFFNMYKDWGLDPNTILYPDPDKKFGVLYFLDLRKWVNNEIILWKVNLNYLSDKFKNIKVNKKQTMEEQFLQGRRPHISWVSLYPQICELSEKIYEGTFENIF